MPDLTEPGRCPLCAAGIGGAAGVHWNAASIWCLRCGWAQNWPATATIPNRQETP